LLFIAFLWALFAVATEREWPAKRWALAFVCSLLPFGTFVFDRALQREIESIRPN
jgi:integral membrane protein